jgi:type I restriction enzyme R subunit
MNKISENKIESFAIELFRQEAYGYVYGPTMAPDGEKPERTAYSEVILKSRLIHAVNILNPSIPKDARQQTIREITAMASPDLINTNENFHTLLTNGIDVEFQKEGDTRGDKVWLVDFEIPENNEFLVVNQFTVTEENVKKRPDIILFINGLPLVVIELKNPVDEGATLHNAFNQLQTYKSVISSLFAFNSLLVISDGLEARVGSLSSGFNRFSAWKTKDGKIEASKLVNQMEILICGMLNKRTLLDLIRYFTVFEKSGTEDARTGMTMVLTEKKIAYYHQYFAVNKALESVKRASAVPEKDLAVREDPAVYGLPTVQDQKKGDKKGGVIWHTQGSGKSLSMVFFTGKLVLALDNPTIVILTDRNDLDDQLFDTFAASRQLLRQDPVQAENSNALRELLKVASGGIVFTTVQKFSPLNGEAVYPLLSKRSNILVIADEAHRSQYGFKAREVDIKDEKSNITGKRTLYGFAKYIRDALPNATFVGFTGTPVELTDKNTPAVFGHYIDIYDISQAVKDRATVKIYYESRLARIRIDEEGQKLIDDLDEDLEREDISATDQAKARWTRVEAIVGSKDRVAHIARDIVTHFTERLLVFEGKAMIVAMTRRIAVRLHDEIIKLKPQWYSTDLDKGAIKVVMTASSSDGPKMERHHTSKIQRRRLADRFKDPQDPLKIVIVRDMWLTGFDAPCLHSLYIDKPMKGHSLMQAIARVNRVYLDKPGGLIVDYIGIASHLKKALSFYTAGGGKGKPTQTQEDAINLMLSKLETIEQMLDKLSYKVYFSADMQDKLSIILKTEEYILGIDNGKDRFINEVTALSKAFSLSIPSNEAMDIKEKVSFFQAVKARLQKFGISEGGMASDEIGTAIRQVIDKAVVSDKVIDIFDAAGIKKPDISILSDEFMEEIKGMEHKNLALELLKKLLNDEIRSRKKTNIVQSRKLFELLDTAVKKYQNKLLTSTEVIEELIQLAKDIKKADQRGEELGLSIHELAFYDALSQIQSARDVMGKNKLRELSAVLVERIKSNVTIDWNIKENVQAKMKVIVKRLLRKYGYPPDMQALATKMVLDQANLFSDFQVNN